MMQYHDIIFCILVWYLGLSVTQAKPLLNTYIVQLANSSVVNSFPPSTFAQNYSIRHRFNSEELFTGVSLTLTDTNDASDIVLSARLRQLPGVVSVFPVPAVTPSKVASVVAARDVSASPYEEYPSPQPMTPIVGTKNSKLASPLEMTGIDKLHSLGIKGRGMKIAFLDTGVDYRHPALGGGFGLGHKIAGGYSFMDDSGALVNSTDPFADCLSDVGGHGTHVTGIATMQRCANCSFDIEGVAPEASVYMYRVFGCDGGEAGLDTHFAAMLMAADEGVDVISMSIGDGDVNIADPTNPFSTTAAAIKQKGIAIFAAAANDATGGASATNLRTVEFPGADSNIIAVGSVVNAQWPTMYSATDSHGNSFSYASIFPFNTTKMDVYVVSSPCDSDQWATILPGVNLNTTVFVFEGTIGCNLADATSSWRELVEPQDVYAISYQGNWTTDPYLQSVGADTPGFLPDRNLAEFFQADGLSLMEQYTKAGGYPNYKLSFVDKRTFSVPLETGGMMDYYSSFGPVGVEPLRLKPQLSGPGGNILSTYPLGPGSGYAISSGTSMSTPFAAASYMLIKSQLPHATVDQILERMQTTSTPLKWIYDTSILSATAQQGSGLINCYNAIFGTTLVSPGELNIGDATPSSPAKATITIKNDALISKAYRLSHQGAAYMDQILNSTGQNQFETGQLPNYGSAKFSSSVVLLQPGQSTSVTMSISPPPGVDEEQLPIFGGFITITDITDRTAAILSVPYIARPYSLYNATYIPQIIAGQITVPGILCYNDNTGEANYPANGTLACDFSDGSQINILGNLAQYTMLYRIDVVPVNTTLIPTHWAPGSPSTPPGYTYTPPDSPPSSSVLGGVPSYGNIYNLNPTANIEYAANPQSTIITNLPWSGSVTTDGGSTLQLGSGDYRLLISVLRWGGNDSVTADYETWLGPIMTLS